MALIYMQLPILLVLASREAGMLVFWEDLQLLLSKRRASAICLGNGTRLQDTNHSCSSILVVIAYVAFILLASMGMIGSIYRNDLYAGIWAHSD